VIEAESELSSVSRAAQSDEALVAGNGAITLNGVPEHAIDDSVVARVEQAVEGAAAAFAGVVDSAIDDAGDSGARQRVTAMRDLMKRHAAAFASEADTADMIPRDFIERG
jgi:hypothetical protein